VADPVSFDGFDEAKRALAKLGDVEKSRAYKTANFDIANEVVIPAAMANARALGKMQVKAAQTLKALRTASGGSVSLGKGFAGALGAEFGADRNQRRQGRPHGKSAPVTGWQQFEPWRGSSTGAGYFLWPAIRQETDEIVNRYKKLFDELFDEDGNPRGDG
jgi:hypothetical protein